MDSIAQPILMMDWMAKKNGQQVWNTVNWCIICYARTMAQPHFCKGTPEEMWYTVIYDPDTMQFAIVFRVEEQEGCITTRRVNFATFPGSVLIEGNVCHPEKILEQSNFRVQMAEAINWINYQIKLDKCVSEGVLDEQSDIHHLMTDLEVFPHDGLVVNHIDADFPHGVDRYVADIIWDMTRGEWIFETTHTKPGKNQMYYRTLDVPTIKCYSKVDKVFSNALSFVIN